MKPVIEVSNISKSYRISHQDEMKADYSTLKDDFSNLIKRPFGGGEKINRETFWALKDVSFEVAQGDFFGIIGKNGSGKSTLLKILSRIVSPTSGAVKIHGRIASLLEVGTGFHPELTGRENIFFNGSMLGMGRQEIRKKFNDIVEFSEIEKFLDTPVKFYSSGMFVRLAFSVAAHLDPEILILDEVLSVGDAGFQKKSMDKMLSFSEGGRTILFVSHSMSAVRQLCGRGLLLKDGKIDFLGDTETLIARYLDIMQKEAPEIVINSHWKNDGSVTNDIFEPREVYIKDSRGKRVDGTIKNSTDHWLYIEGLQKQVPENFNVGFMMQNPDTHAPIYLSMSTDGPQDSWPKIKKGPIMFRALLPKHYLNAGNYKVAIVASLHNRKWLLDPYDSPVGIELSINGGLSESPFWKSPRDGILAPIVEWETA